ncbi:sulfite reductase (NADPH) subunit beta [Lachancea thermotolerans CBS 6340]|uniref:Sulfite reductase [NADPH] subunit beta n=1 Tax=Lachancea thermotolerans (strain ATCC 56472 / CBS 6340 / NRRL Y-8284) TaxID=559295 RepID=C5DFS4_LACTC|nr:KLTH0D17512p [Lachancea thermotolerans CBS 6340]CAR23029.1 KLTH0D17512p [Lachancea thermotolerans CBS 6340]
MAKLTPAKFLADLSAASESSIYYTTEAKSISSGFSSALGGSDNLPGTQLLKSADPFATVVEGLTKERITTVFTDEATLLSALPHLYSLKGYPVVVNIELALNEYSAAPLLKDLSYVTLISNTSDNLSRHAVAATRIASETLQPVLHFVNLACVGEIAPVKLTPFEVAQEPSEGDAVYETLKKSSYHCSAESPSTLIINLSPYGESFVRELPSNAALIDIQVYRPWNFNEFFEQVPTSVQNIAIIQRTNNPLSPSGFEPILLDFFADFNLLVERGIQQLIVTNIGELKETARALQEVVQNVTSTNPDHALFIGQSASNTAEVEHLQSSIQKVFSLEDAYLKVLKQLFSDNLQILNNYSDSSINASSPEYGYGLFVSQEKKRQELVSIVRKSLDTASFNSSEGVKIVELLSKWLRFNEQPLKEASLEEANKVAVELYDLLERNQDSRNALNILENAKSVESFKFTSSWLIGSDAWSYDLGSSGVHHVLASKKDINVLLIDSEPHEQVKNSTSKLRKKDVGLYAMNFGEAYVASVAVYSSYTQLLTSLIEASKFKGPSIVLAYLPYSSENSSPLEVLKETKSAVESGYWPLYRYDPREDDPEDAFKLESSVIKRQLQQFLERENKLSLLTKKNPDLARNLKQSASGGIEAKQQRRAKAAYEALLEGLSGPPLHIYYASDGGNAANLAKRLATRAAARGLKASALSMDDIDFETFPDEENVIFVTSTAGQGEFPQDGKAFWDTLKASLDIDLASLNFSVFGLGDSLYWPRKEDKHYYNKPSKDLYAKLELLSAKPLVPLGLGDDQDADGYQTGYKEWEVRLWEALGVSGAAVPDEPKPITNEDIKIESNFLRGTIVEGLADDSTGAISASDQQLTKFHGIYMQDDRDIRDTRKAQGLEPYYIFMSRIRLPGGKATPEQWLVLDHLADKTGNGTVKVTTRATFQLHGVVKRNLKHTIRAMNSTLMDTLAACGDVNRNVMLSALPVNAKVHKQVSDISAKISEHLLPQTTAYHEIWLEGADEKDESPNWPSIFENRQEGPIKKKTLVSGNALVDQEPLYGPTYLPRKFKVNVTVPPFNDVDVWSSDVGLIAIVDEKTQVVKGFNLYVGGGMGTTHNNKKTYPRTGSSFGFVKAEDVHIAIEKVMIVQRDNGDRQNRKHARLKYTIDDMGVEVYKQKVEELWGKKFEPEQPYEIKSNIDYFGWVRDETGMNHFTIFIENGRIEDTVDLPQKTGLKKVALHMQKTNSGHFRLTGNQHVVISDIKDENLEDIKLLLKKYKLDNTSFSGLRLSSAACVALPTCGLAMAESERYLPVLIAKLEDALEQYGLRHDSIVMRMTGCPNGCARPWLAEVACVGKAPGTYNLMLGGGYYGQRLNKLYRASIKEEEILGILKPLFKKWSLERGEGEHFGDYLIRTGVIKPTLEGKYFHDDVSEDAL